MTKVMCPNVIAAVMAAETHKNKDLWAIGAALIKDCGGDDDTAPARTRAGRHNGSTATLDIAAEELQALGYDYSAGTLRNIRDVTVAFPVKDRIPNLSFWLHSECGNPALLQWVLKNAPDKKAGRKNKYNYAIDLYTIRAMIKQWRTMHLDKNRERHEQAKDRKHAAQTRYEHATDLNQKRAAKADLEAAKQEVRETRPMPKGSLPAPDEKATGGLQHLAAITRMSRKIDEARDSLIDFLSDLRSMPNIDDEIALSYVEDSEVIIKTANQIIDLMKRKPHLKVVS